MKTIRVKGNTQEWFDDEIREAIKSRDKLFKTFKKTRNYNDNQKYKRTRNHVQCLIKRKKKQFITEKLEENIGRPKELWRTLKSLGLSKTNSSPKICLEKDNNLSFDPKEIAETFKDYFSNLAGNLVIELPTPPGKFSIESLKGYYEKYNLDGWK